MVITTQSPQESTISMRNGLGSANAQLNNCCCVSIYYHRISTHLRNVSSRHVQLITHSYIQYKPHLPLLYSILPRFVGFSRNTIKHAVHYKFFNSYTFSSDVVLKSSSVLMLYLVSICIMVFCHGTSLNLYLCKSLMAG